jgi:malate dehydrogenase (oxaloacetate-decarboxylating)(NADP+)
MKKTNIDHYTDKEALDFHKDKKPGRLRSFHQKI